MTPAPVLCLTHVGWQQAASRPRQLMTQLAADRAVYFFETRPYTSRMPLVGAVRSGAVTVLTPYLPAHTPAADGHRMLAPLLEATLDGDGVQLPIVWCFDAQSLPLVAALPTRVVIYDCSGEPPAGADVEAAALARADIVFAADIDDYARLRPCHDCVHLVPGSATWPSTCAAMDAIVEGATAAGPGALAGDSAPEARGYRVIRGGAPDGHRRH